MAKGVTRHPLRATAARRPGPLFGAGDLGGRPARPGTPLPRVHLCHGYTLPRVTPLPWVKPFAKGWPPRRFHGTFAMGDIFATGDTFATDNKNMQKIRINAKINKSFWDKDKKEQLITELNKEHLRRISPYLLARKLLNP